MTAKVQSSVVLGECGIVVHHRDTKISLDPSRSVDCDFTFVSHAHMDHLHRKNGNFKSKLLASRATSLIAHARGYEIGAAAEEHDGFQLIDTGHILGSRGLLIGGEIYYTGDMSTRERAFLKPAHIPRVRTLVIESTFGKPEYVFPDLTEIIHRTNKIISEMYDLGVPVILMGYPLGKAQLLTSLFGHWDPVYVHDSVARMNSIYSELGIDLADAIRFSEAQKSGLLSKSKPWVMIAPLMHSRSAFVKQMKEEYGAVTIGFSGWAANSRYKFMMGLDHVLPLSDHCDFRELVAAVKACRPNKVYTFHGFAADFAKSLKNMGFDAQPIGSGSRIDEKSITLDAFQET